MSRSAVFERSNHWLHAEAECGANDPSKAAAVGTTPLTGPTAAAEAPQIYTVSRLRYVRVLRLPAMAHPVTGAADQQATHATQTFYFSNGRLQRTKVLGFPVDALPNS